MGAVRSCALILATVLLFTGCAPKTPVTPHLQENITPFLDQLPPPLSEMRQHRLYADLLSHRYLPWRLEALEATRKQARWAERFYAKKALFGENRRPLDQSRFVRWLKNGAFDDYNTLCRHAVTIHPTALRLFPTMRPIFYNPSLEGEGYPFDYAQNSSVKAFTPLIVSHLSRDRGWAFAQTPFASGWIPMRDIAYLSKKQIDTLMVLPLVVVTKEQTPVYDEKQNFLFLAKMATMLPCVGEEDGFYKVLVPKSRDKKLTTRVSLLSKEATKKMPLPMDKAHVRQISMQLLGEPYGWGGLVNDRDCSAMTRDFFAPFGIWLPRNSKAQAQKGRIVNLKGLNPQAKEARILSEGVPFHTLLYMKGHIMLYVGKREGRAWAMHNMWGIHTIENGRYIIGKAIISDLWLGKDLPMADKRSLFIKRIESINFPAE